MFRDYPFDQVFGIFKFSRTLAELFGSPLSVLNGRAGTGKTRLISVLANHERVRQGGLLLLAPTGKARVRLG